MKKKENTESISQIDNDKNKNDGMKSIDNKLSKYIYIDNEIINIQIKIKKILVFKKVNLLNWEKIQSNSFF